MSETHIAHAIATFSELGIGSSFVLLTDVITDLRTELRAQLIIATESRRVIQSKYHDISAGFDATLRILLRKYIWLREKLFNFMIVLFLGLLQWSPYICVALGVFSLLGISFYPTAPDFIPPFLTFKREDIDLIYLQISLLSFMVVFFPVLTLITKKIINWYALRDIEIE